MTVTTLLLLATATGLLVMALATSDPVWPIAATAVAGVAVAAALATGVRWSRDRATH